MSDLGQRMIAAFEAGVRVRRAAEEAEQRRQDREVQRQYHGLQINRLKFEDALAKRKAVLADVALQEQQPDPMRPGLGEVQMPPQVVGGGETPAVQVPGGRLPGTGPTPMQRAPVVLPAVEDPEGGVVLPGRSVVPRSVADVLGRMAAIKNAANVARAAQAPGLGRGELARLRHAGAFEAALPEIRKRILLARVKSGGGASTREVLDGYIEEIGANLVKGGIDTVKLRSDLAKALIVK